MKFVSFETIDSVTFEKEIERTNGEPQMRSRVRLTKTLLDTHPADTIHIDAMSVVGLGRPMDWPRTIVVGISIGLALKLVLKAVVLPALALPAINPTYHYLVGNTRALLQILPVMILVGGVGEEILWRGLLFAVLRSCLRRQRWRSPIVVLVSSVLFAAAHYADQGVPGVIQASFTGTLFGTLYAIRGDIWASVVAHATYDVAAILIIYFDWEVRLAQSFL